MTKKNRKDKGGNKQQGEKEGDWIASSETFDMSGLGLTLPGVKAPVSIAFGFLGKHEPQGYGNRPEEIYEKKFL